MAQNTTENGKAFEYACLLGIYEYLKEQEDIEIEDSAQLQTAQKYFKAMPEAAQENLKLAGKAAARVIIRMEPQLKYPQNNIPLYLCIQTDAQGIIGDVRDVLCIRRQNKWEIGISCKHNHNAVKHSRLSDKIDFGKEWFNVPCSEKYFSDIVPIFSKLRYIRDSSKNDPVLWKDIQEKTEKYYRPILMAFLQEMKRLSSQNPEIPTLLIKYLVGKYDFYKAISDDRHRITRVEAINIFGTLNRPAGKNKSIIDVTSLRLPTRFFHLDFVPGSNTTVEIICDNGWEVSMRIHNASSRVEPSLKFDVKLQSLPSSIYAQIEPWDNEK